jgi:hypothetical protein
MTKMIEELEGREGEWKDTPMAARNKLLLKKWREKIKVTSVLCRDYESHDLIYSYKICLLFDRNLWIRKYVRMLCYWTLIFYTNALSATARQQSG